MLDFAVTCQRFCISDRGKLRWEPTTVTNTQARECGRVQLGSSNEPESQAKSDLKRVTLLSPLSGEKHVTFSGS